MYEIYVRERASRSARTLAFDATGKLGATGPWSIVCGSVTGSISGGQSAWRMSAHGQHERAWLA
jgi:hypothetical protein